MKIGLQIPWFNWPGSPMNTGEKLREIAQTADVGGYDTIWVMDHLYQVRAGFGPIDDPMLEGYTTLGYIASATDRIKLGLMVTSAFYRPPGLLIKMVTSLDVLSRGRAILGIGAGWDEVESKAFGIRYPPKGERFGRLKETLQIAKHLWSGDHSTFDGKYYKLENPILSPIPISRPHPPILIGGEGEKQTLRLVAEYGDACNLHLGTPLPGFAPWMNQRYENFKKELEHKLSVLQEHCYNIGRDYSEIDKTCLGTVKLSDDAMKIEEIISLCKELSDLGFDQVIFNMPNAHEISPVKRIGEAFASEFR